MFFIQFYENLSEQFKIVHSIGLFGVWDWELGSWGPRPSSVWLTS